MSRLALTLTAMAALSLPATAQAFCGFYVGNGESQLVADATQVALMRDGNRTVLSMANNYRGPAQDFAMVVPVPVVLQEEDVKTLPAEVFETLNIASAPRLVEYVEANPCWTERQYDLENSIGLLALMGAVGGGVEVEAEFAVGEYEIVILSASDSAGLDSWLRAEGYRIPEGAEPVLRPYVQNGSKFFVARVDVDRVSYDRFGRAVLSPLRFHYEAEEFALPVRLGLLNAQGPQDLIIHILSRGQRYEVANRPNVVIPTNLDVNAAVRHDFAGFYTALFDRTLDLNPGAVVTEFAWPVMTGCDPCTPRSLSEADLMTLGMDIVGGSAGSSVVDLLAGNEGRFVATRLHARYTADDLDSDLVFRAVPPIRGGLEWRQKDGTLDHGAQKSADNRFQARYAIRHLWSEPLTCESPIRGRWERGRRRDAVAPSTADLTGPRGELELESLLTAPLPASLLPESAR